MRGDIYFIYSLVMIKDIEVLFPSIDTEKGSSTDPNITNSLVAQFLLHLDQLGEDDSDMIVVYVLFFF